MPDFLTIALVGGIFSIAAALHGICGFGFSLVAVGVLAGLVGPKTAVPLCLMASSVNCFYLAWLLRRSILYKQVIGLLIIAGLFVPIGAYFLCRLEAAIIMKSMGLVILVISLVSLIKLNKLKIFSSRPYKWFAGALGGLLGGAFTLPGPPLVLYAYNCNWSTRDAMASLQLIWAVLSIIQALTYCYNGLLTQKIFCWGIIYAPVVLFFTFLGSLVSKRMHIHHLNIFINVFLVALGLNLIIRG